MVSGGRIASSCKRVKRWSSAWELWRLSWSAFWSFLVRVVRDQRKYLSRSKRNKILRFFIRAVSQFSSWYSLCTTEEENLTLSIPDPMTTWEKISSTTTTRVAEKMTWPRSTSPPFKSLLGARYRKWEESYHRAKYPVSRFSLSFFFLLLIIQRIHFGWHFIPRRYPTFDYLRFLDTLGPEPNVGIFIEDHKKRADSDPNAPPFDDLRNYAYEGGGSIAGSLSSLASGT